MLIIIHMDIITHFWYFFTLLVLFLLVTIARYLAERHYEKRIKLKDLFYAIYEEDEKLSSDEIVFARAAENSYPELPWDPSAFAREIDENQANIAKLELSGDPISRQQLIGIMNEGKDSSRELAYQALLRLEELEAVDDIYAYLEEKIANCQKNMNSSEEAAQISMENQVAAQIASQLKEQDQDQAKDKDLQALLFSLAHSDPNIRAFAVKTLGRAGILPAWDRIEPLLSDEDKNVRYSTIKAMERMGSREKLMKTIIPMIAESDPDRFVRLAARKALR